MFSLFGKKRDHPAPPSPPWLKWALVAFVAFALLSSLHKGTPQAPNPVHEAFHQAAENLNPKKFYNLADYKSKLFPSYAGELRIHDIEEGKGQPAVCGQQVKITYETFLGQDKKIDDSATKDKPLAFHIGEGKVMPALEQGVVGMKSGGKRSLLSPTGMAYGLPAYSRSDVPAGALVRFETELLDITPPLPDAPYRITTVSNGTGHSALCGEPTKAHVTIWSIDGKKLFESGQPIGFTPGKSEVFLGLEQGVIGLATGGMRTLIVPPAFQKTMDGNPPITEFPFPKDQTVLVDVELLP